MLKDMKIHQLESQKALEKQIADLLKGPAPKAYYPPNQYGNRSYPGNQYSPLRGCYFDGGAHSRNTCEELEKALERGDVHKKRQSLFLGPEDSNSGIRVPIPVEDSDGKVMWQKGWVAKELMKKESQAFGAANSVTLEKPWSVSGGVLVGGALVRALAAAAAAKIRERAKRKTILRSSSLMDTR